MRYKVFISSTYTDLKDYRNELREAIIKAEFDLISMESYAADETTPLERSKKDIASCDIFIVILGNRYGYIVPSYNKSITQVETEFAIELNKPVLIFIHKNPSELQAPPDTDNSRLIEFKNFLMDRYLVGFFDNPQDLVANAYAALYNLTTRLQKREDIQHKQQAEVVEKEKPQKKLITRGVTDRKPTGITTKGTNGLTIIKLLLSSPGDVSEERERFSKAVFRFNNEYTIDKHVFLHVIRWEDMAPQIGKSPQFTINNQIGYYDIFLGIMWNRFGTPTDIASSGTEEEFNTALSNWTGTKIPWITFYFSSRAKNLSTTEQLQQKQKVIEFKEKISKMGIYREYKNLNSFEDIIFEDLKRIVSAPNFHKKINL